MDALTLPRTVCDDRRLAVEAAYRAHRDRVFHLCLRYGAGDVAWAEDLTHEVFLKLLEHVPRLERPDELSGWLYRVAANSAISRLRRERYRRALLGRFGRVRPAPAPTAEMLMEQSEEATQALRLLQRIPPKQRVVLCMKYLDGRSQCEIAALLGYSEGYVSKLLKRALGRARAAGWEVTDDVA
jgi:RNA polymerase sigma-70 factor (ECF subfamily)